MRHINFYPLIIFMLIKEQFTENVIEQVSKILGEAITGGEIECFFRECSIQESPYGGSTKWRRLNASFVANQRIVHNAASICKCIEKILAPVRFIGKEEEFKGCRNEINKVLAFEGYELDERGKIKSIQKATTLI